MAKQPNSKKRSLSKQGRVKLADVAASVGVSVMTVSNVVRGRKDLVREETWEVVQRAIAQLKYRPHSFGRGLRLSKTSTIGMLIVVSDENFLSSPWTSRVVAGLSNYLNEHGYALLIHRQTPVSLAESVLMRFSNTDGMCVMVSGTDAVRKALLSSITQLGQPIVALQEPHDPKQFQDFAIVKQDDRGAGKKIAEHLVDQGARKMIFLEPDLAFVAMSERRAGIDGILRRRQLPTLTTLQCPSEDPVRVANVLARYLEDHEMPDAIIAGNEFVAMGVLMHLEKSRIKTPRDVLFSCFNAFDLWSYGLNRMTTIDFPAYEIGVTVGRCLVDRLANGKFSSTQQILPGDLKIGGTTVSAREHFSRAKLVGETTN